MSVSGVVVRLIRRRGDCIGVLESYERPGRGRHCRAEKVSSGKLHARGFGVARKESMLRKDPLLPGIAVIGVLINLFAYGHPSAIDIERQPAMNARQLE